MPDRDADDINELDDVVEGIAQTLRAPVRLSDDFQARVLSAVRAERPRHVPRPRTSVRDAWRWLARGREVRISPLGGLAIAAGLAGVVFLAASAGRNAGARASEIAAEVDPTRSRNTAPRKLARETGVGIAATSGRLPVPVQFLVSLALADSVSLVGDFNDWNASITPLRRTSTPGVWSVTITLAPGRYQYTFVVDGTKRITDPGAPSLRDDFGTTNSVITVLERST